MFHTFNTELQIFPGLVAEHIMLSIAEGSRMGEADFSKHIIFSPSDVSLFSVGVLGSLYYRLSLRANTSRILYLWSDESLCPDTIYVPASQGVSQVLGKKIVYDKTLSQGLIDQDIVADDTYFVKSDFRYTHTHHISFLEGVEVLPIVFANTYDLSKYTDHLINFMEQSKDIVIIIADPIHFRIEETIGGSQILALKIAQCTRFDIFCRYCDRRALVPHIMKVEVVEHNDGDSIYQGLLLV